MQWFRSRREKLLKCIYENPAYGGVPDNLEAHLPLFVGGAIFAALDIGLGLQDPIRLILLTVLIAPGVGWLLYLLGHQIKALVQWWIAHKERLQDRD